VFDNSIGISFASGASRSSSRVWIRLEWQRVQHIRHVGCKVSVGVFELVYHASLSAVQWPRFARGGTTKSNSDII